MNHKTTVTISNFTCTFQVDNKPLPLLDYFTNIIYPAFSDITLSKENKSSNNSYYITDLKLIKINDSVIALSGKHVKRTLLEISKDFSPKLGFHGEDNKEHSAPYSTFILTLNNHRLIYFKNKKGAPSLINFQSTCRDILFKYIQNTRSRLIESFKKNNYLYNEKRYTVTSFKSEVLNPLYPFPTLHIVPIESKRLVDSKFNELDKISKVTFSFYPTNNEPINIDNIFEQCFSLLDYTQSKSTKQILHSPQNKESIKDAINSSEGKTLFKVEGKTLNNSPVVITPDHVNETYEVNLSEPNAPIEDITYEVYNQLKNKKALNKESVENKNLFNKMKNNLVPLIFRG